MSGKSLVLYPLNRYALGLSLVSMSVLEKAVFCYGLGLGYEDELEKLCSPYLKCSVLSQNELLGRSTIDGNR